MPSLNLFREPVYRTRRAARRLYRVQGSNHNHNHKQDKFKGLSRSQAFNAVVAPPNTTPPQSPLAMFERDSNTMAAAEGMLKLFYGSAPVQTWLTMQTPTIQVTPPILEPPQADAGAQQGDEEDVTNSNGKRRGSDHEEQKPVKRTKPVPLDSKTHFEQKYVLCKRLAEGDNGETFAAFLKSDLIDLLAEHGNDRGPTFFDAVRDKLVAVKFAKPDNAEGDLSGEIQFFTEDFPHKHPSINAGLDSHLDGDCQWLVLPYAQGGSVLGFMEKDFSNEFSLSFRWHFAAQVAEALLFLFFGVRDADNLPAKTPKWSIVTHRDIFVGNTLLDKPAPDDPTGFPRCIVADFGRAEAMRKTGCQCSGCEANAAMMRSDQSLDIQQLGHVLQELTSMYLEATYPCKHGDWAARDIAEDAFNDAEGICSRCKAVVVGLDEPEGGERVFREWLDKTRTFTSSKSNFADAYRFLGDLYKLAKEQKMATFQPLSAEATAHLNKHFVSDKDLKRVLGIHDRLKLVPKSRK